MNNFNYIQTPLKVASKIQLAVTFYQKKDIVPRKVAKIVTVAICY